MIFLLNFPKHHKHFADMTKTNDFIKALLCTLRNNIKLYVLE